MTKLKNKRIPSSGPMGTLEAVEAGEYFGTTKFDWSGDLPIYRGRHTNVAADGTETNWQITKFTWSGDNPTDIQVQFGVWDDRATLSW